MGDRLLEQRDVAAQITPAVRSATPSAPGAPSSRATATVSSDSASAASCSPERRVRERGVRRTSAGERAARGDPRPARAARTSSRSSSARAGVALRQPQATARAEDVAAERAVRDEPVEPGVGEHPVGLVQRAVLDQAVHERRVRGCRRAKFGGSLASRPSSTSARASAMRAAHARDERAVAVDDRVGDPRAAPARQPQRLGQVPVRDVEALAQQQRVDGQVERRPVGGELDAAQRALGQRGDVVALAVRERLVDRRVRGGHRRNGPPRRARGTRERCRPDVGEGAAQPRAAHQLGLERQREPRLLVPRRSSPADSASTAATVSPDDVEQPAEAERAAPDLGGAGGQLERLAHVRLAAARGPGCRPRRARASAAARRAPSPTGSRSARRRYTAAVSRLARRRASSAARSSTASHSSPRVVGRGEDVRGDVLVRRPAADQRGRGARVPALALGGRELVVDRGAHDRVHEGQLARSARRSRRGRGASADARGGRPRRGRRARRPPAASRARRGRRRPGRAPPPARRGSPIRWPTISLTAAPPTRSTRAD